MKTDGKSLGNSKLFADCNAGLFDGFRVDRDGRIWTSAGDGVHCFLPNGDLIGQDPHPRNWWPTSASADRSATGCSICALHLALLGLSRHQRVIAWSQCPCRMNEGVMARRAEIAAALRRILPVANVIDADPACAPTKATVLRAYRQPPLVVALPETTEQVSEVLRYAHANGIKIVPRGAGTSLSGGALPLADGILLGMAKKFNRVLEVDYANRCAVVQPGCHQPRHHQGGRTQGLLLRA